MTTNATTSETPTVLGDWVEMRSEPGRAGRTVHLAVNRRDGNALLLDDADIEQVRVGTPVDDDLVQALAESGFLADGPQPVAPPAGGRVVRALRTFDVRWNGADRWIARVHDGGLHRAWRPAAIAGQCVLAVLGAVALIALLTSGRPLHLRPSPWEVPIYVALSVVAIAVHELAHGLVVAHHGRRVAAVGFRLHLGSPSCYVESVEALLLTRRQRIAQAAAGPWAEWLVLSVVAIIAWSLPLGPLTAIVHRFVVLGAFTIATNLLPFAGLDGSLILADVLREPHLAAESRRAAARLGEGQRRRGDGLLVAYATANTLVSGALLASSIVFWWILFGGVITWMVAHGPLGLAGAAVLVLVSFGPWLASGVPLLRRVALVDRMLFRLERRRRIRMTERFATVAPFDRLDERSLGILAGQLRLHRVHRAAPLHVAGFSGVVAADGPLLVGHEARPVTGGVATVTGSGLSARAVRRLLPTRVGLLPAGSLRLLGLEPLIADAG